MTLNSDIQEAGQFSVDGKQYKTVDGKHVPYDSAADFLALIPATRRHVGQIAYILNGSAIEEWHFVGGIADVNFEVVNNTSSGGARFGIEDNADDPDTPDREFNSTDGSLTETYTGAEESEFATGAPFSPTYAFTGILNIKNTDTGDDIASINVTDDSNYLVVAQQIRDGLNSLSVGLYYDFDEDTSTDFSVINGRFFADENMNITYTLPPSDSHPSESINNATLTFLSIPYSTELKRNSATAKISATSLSGKSGFSADVEGMNTAAAIKSDNFLKLTQYTNYQSPYDKTTNDLTNKSILVFDTTDVGDGEAGKVYSISLADLATALGL